MLLNPLITDSITVEAVSSRYRWLSWLGGGSGLKMEGLNYMLSNVWECNTVREMEDSNLLHTFSHFWK